MNAPQPIDFPDPAHEGENRIDPAVALLLETLEQVEAKQK